MAEFDEQMLFEMGYSRGFHDGIKGSIPKSDYENRLKADMVAMLTELDNKIMEEYIEHMEVDWHDIIQQKINSLKEIKDGNGD